MQQQQFQSANLQRILMGANGPKQPQPSTPAPNSCKTDATIGIHQQALQQHQERANQQQRLTVKVAMGLPGGQTARNAPYGRQQQFMAFIDRRVHRSPADFLQYLSQSMTIGADSILMCRGHELLNLDEVENQETLILTTRTEIAESLAAGQNPADIQGPGGQIKQEYQLNRGVPRERPQGYGNSSIKQEPGVEHKEAERPRANELVNQIKSLTPMNQPAQESAAGVYFPTAAGQNSFVKGEEGIPNGIQGTGQGDAPQEDKRGILEQYMRKVEPTHEENEQVYSRLMQLQGFSPYDSWVPMPFPHRELTYARGMYMRGESLTVQTPNFADYANSIAEITSRNELIFRLKRMCLQRGFRAKLSMSTTNETKSLTVIFLCNRSGKSSLRCKNPSVKGLCPFMLHYERKSQIGSNRGYYRQAAMSSAQPNVDQTGERKKYRAIGQAYDRLFKAPPPQANVKSENLANQMAKIGTGADDIIQDDENHQMNINPEEVNTEQEFQPNVKSEQNEDLKKQMELFEYNCELPSERKQVDEEKEKSKFSDLIEDIDLEGNPFYLKYYRSFHNHDLDTHLMENEDMVSEDTLHRKGAPSYLPQGTLAIQYYMAERRKEIVEEGTANQFRFPFDHKSQTLTRFKPLDPSTEPILIEPQGSNPFLIFCDATLDEDSMPTPSEQANLARGEVEPLIAWDPQLEFLEQQRVHTIRTMIKLLSQVRSKLATGVYSLDKWRRILMNMNPKKPGAGGGGGGKKKKVATDNVGKPGMTSGNTKLSNIVNKILASRTGEDCIMGSDDNDEEKEGAEDNYDVYA